MSDPSPEKFTMRRHLLALLCAVCLVWAPGLGAVEPDPGAAADEQTLKAARLGTDGPALLEFFRKRTLPDVDRDKIQALIRQLGDDSFPVREKASADLVVLGTVAVTPLRQAVKDPDIEVVRRAEECLRRIEKGDSAAVAVAAARLVALRKLAGAAEVLLAYLPFAYNETVAEEVQTTLAALAVRDGKPEPALVRALEDKVPGQRAAAAVALCRSDVAEPRPALRQLLKDSEPLVRLRVALALAIAKEKEAIPVLIALLGHLPPAQAWQVEDLLYRLAEEQAPPVATGNDEAARRRCRDAWAGWWQANQNKVDLAKLGAAPPLLGYTLVVLLDQGRVLELDAAGKPRWQIDGVQLPLDAQLLPGDRVLVAEHQANQVTERNREGKVLWKKEIEGPLVAQRLPNGNTFIATRSQFLEVDRAGKEVFSRHPPDGEQIMKAQKLRNGEIACVTSVLNTQTSRFLRLDAGSKELQAFPVQVRTYGGRIDVLPGGRVLVPELTNNKVIEYNAEGKAIWDVTVEQPIAAVRLPNGNTLVTSMSQNRAIEFDRRGKEVWEYKSDTRVTRAFRR